MRAFVIAFMITLLPLRGWAGDAMAEHLALAQAAVPASTSHAHCALHDAGVEMTTTQDDTAVHDGCTLCQACHTLALEACISSATAVTSPILLTRVAASDFASAERALSVKPPIV